MCFLPQGTGLSMRSLISLLVLMLHIFMLMEKSYLPPCSYLCCRWPHWIPTHVGVLQTAAFRLLEKQSPELDLCAGGSTAQLKSKEGATANRHLTPFPKPAGWPLLFTVWAAYAASNDGLWSNRTTSLPDHQHRPHQACAVLLTDPRMHHTSGGREGQQRVMFLW